jgi:F0F1-type ATP synthase assembly protein I
LTLSERKNKQKQINSAFAQAGPYLNIAYFFMGSMAVLGFVGYKLDQYFNFRFLFLLTGLFLGLVLGFYHMFKVIRQIEKNNRKDA